jgi:hypothetical protein
MQAGWHSCNQGLHGTVDTTVRRSCWGRCLTDHICCAMQRIVCTRVHPAQPVTTKKGSFTGALHNMPDMHIANAQPLNMIDHLSATDRGPCSRLFKPYKEVDLAQESGMAQVLPTK